MITSIKTDLKNYFKVLLHTLHPVLKLSPLEIDVAGKIMLLHFTNRDKVKEDELEESLFSPNVTKAIRESLLPTITEEKFDEIIVSLREKEILLDKKVNPKLVRLYPKIKDTEIGYKIILQP